MAGFLFVYLAQDSSQLTARQPGGAAACIAGEAPCYKSDVTANLAGPNTPAAAVYELPEPKEEQKVELTSRVLYLVDAFARLVMVI